MPMDAPQTKTGAMSLSRSSKWDFTFPNGQVYSLFILFGLGSAIILATISQAVLGTFLLLGFVSIFGLQLCRNTQVKLNDKALQVLGYFWLFKLGLTLFLLYAGWMPQLDPGSSSTWGYDPQRYYFQAKELIDNNWSSNFLNINFAGILYYYGAIFYIIGHNPVIPALVNAFVSLLACLYLVEVGYELKPKRGPHDWTLAFGLLLPELIWYDVMTSRETLLAALLLAALLTAGRYILGTSRLSLSRALAVMALALFGIAAVRTSMIYPVFISFILMILLIKTQHGAGGSQKIILILLAGIMIFIGPNIAAYLGGYEFQSRNAISRISASGLLALNDSNLNWSKNSIGLLLVPNNLFQTILFLPIRMILYLVAPLPNIQITLNDLMAGSWGDWQGLFTILSSIVNIFAFPFALASLIHSVKNRKNDGAALIFHISYWVIFIAIAGGNIMIHERYRVMASLLYLACTWHGVVTCSRHLIIRTSLSWYALLAFASLSYLKYKGIM